MTLGKDMIGGISSHSGLFVDNVSYKDGLSSVVQLTLLFSILHRDYALQDV